MIRDWESLALSKATCDTSEYHGIAHGYGDPHVDMINRLNVSRKFYYWTTLVGSNLVIDN